MIQYVNSFEEAQKFPLVYGDSVILLNSNEDVFYVKAIDRMGKNSISSYKFEQIPNPKPLSSADFVPREQFDALNSKMDMLMNLLASQQMQQAQPQPTPPQSQVMVSSPVMPQPTPTAAPSLPVQPVNVEEPQPASNGRERTKNNGK